MSFNFKKKLRFLVDIRRYKETWNKWILMVLLMARDKRDKLKRDR